MTTERCPPPDGCEIDELGSVALAERFEYLMALAATLVAGAEITARDAARIRRLCHDLELPERATEHVLAAARAPDATRHLDDLDSRAG